MNLNEAVTVAVTLVIVDDDTSFRRIAADLFESNGVVVVADAGDGASGILAVRQHRPDWVLLDVNLPDTDGPTVSRALRRELCGSSILLTSTDDLPWTDAELADAGVHEFVDKCRLLEPGLIARVLSDPYSPR
jgi:two-component system response regulator EvgA